MAVRPSDGVAGEAGGASMAPLAGLRVLELGSRVAVPYLGKLLVDAGADVVKVESPTGDPLRRWSASGAALGDADGAWFRFLNAGKRSVVVDLGTDDGRAGLAAWLDTAHVVLDDHAPARAIALGIDPETLRRRDPTLVVATVTPFGTRGPWAERPANDFVLQALVGSTASRGLPEETPVAVGGDLGDVVGGALVAPAVVAAALTARRSGRGAHVDGSQYEAMMHAFQTYRPLYDAFAPERRGARSIEIPSIEPARDGLVGFCTITGQQWQDFCAMIGHPEMGTDPELGGFEGRMARREEVWRKIRAFTTRHRVDELVEMATAFRIPVGVIGTGDVVAGLDHFVARGVFVQSAHGFTQPRPPYRFSRTGLAPFRPAAALGADGAEASGGPDWGPSPPPDGIGSGDPRRPLAGLRVLDLTAFWAGPIATNALRVLGADLVKIESHRRLDGMRLAGGLNKSQFWEWSPVYHAANAGKRVVDLDLGTPRGLELLARLVAEADVVVENFSPRVTESWGITWDWVRAHNERAVFVRVPAFGLDGPWRDRVGFAMTMEQVSGLAQRTGYPDGPPLVPRGPVDTLAGMHVVVAVLLALATRERTGVGELVEVPLIEAALQAAAEQVVEWTATGELLGRTGNRSRRAAPQGVYPAAGVDGWLAVSVETDAQWRALVAAVGGALDGLDRHDADRVDEALGAWSAPQDPEVAAALLWQAGVPASPCVAPELSGRSPQHDQRGFLQWHRHAIAGWTPYFSFPFQVDGSHLPIGGPAPVLGEHTREVLAGLGVDDDALEELRALGITGDWPSLFPRPG